MRPHRLPERGPPDGGRTSFDQDQPLFQKLCALVYPSAIDLSTAHLRHLNRELAVQRQEIESRWRRLTPRRQALLAQAHRRAEKLPLDRGHLKTGT